MKSRFWIAAVILLLLPIVNAIDGLKISVYLNDTINTGVNYTKLFRVENLDYVTGTNFSIDITCGYNISGVKEDVFYLADLNKYKIAGTGDFFPTDPGNYTLCGWIINSTVADTNSSDDFACKNITAVGEHFTIPVEENETDENEEAEERSEIEIKDFPDEASFGDTINIEFDVYKGDSQSYAVYAYIKEISEKTTIYLHGKNTEYSLRIPVQIKPNCNKRYDEGEYTLEVKGLDTAERKKIWIRGFNEDMCKTKIINNTKVINSTKIVTEECPSKDKMFDVADIKCMADLMNARVVYESSSARSYKLVPILIIALLSLFCIALVWRR